MLPLLLAATAVATPLRYECRVMLLAQGRFTAPTEVTIGFVDRGGTLGDVRVADPTGILYPGGALRVVAGAQATSVEAVPLPVERPGRWSGRAEPTLYRLTLDGGRPGETAEIGIARKPSPATGRFGLVWNASHQPDGLPRPMTGTGGGNCAITPAKDGQ